MNTLELDTRLNALIIERKSREAFLEYYDENVVAQENEDAERVGREPWMQLRLGFETKIKRYAARVLANAANGDTSFSEWEIDVDVEGMGAIHTIQVAVRRWKNGRVVRERFYHK